MHAVLTRNAESAYTCESAVQVFVFVEMHALEVVCTILVNCLNASAIKGNAICACVRTPDCGNAAGTIFKEELAWVPTWKGAKRKRRSEVECQTEELPQGRKSEVPPLLASTGSLSRHSMKCENGVMSSERCGRDISHHAPQSRPRKSPKPTR